MRSVTAVIVLAGLSAAATTASADLLISGSAGSGWQPFPGALNNYSNAARPFWDQDTQDRAGNVTNRNIGNYISGTWTGSLPAGTVPSPNLTPDWWGRPASPDFASTMDNDVSFTVTPPTTLLGSLMRLELAGRANVNELGWYSLADAVGSETLHPIFTGPQGAGTVGNFSPAAAFGLYLKSGNTFYFTQSARNRGDNIAPADLSTQHFAVFAVDLSAGAQSYIIGAEDLPRSGAGREIVGDYNDLVFTLSAIPTPGAAMVLGLGGVAALRRRRR